MNPPDFIQSWFTSMKINPSWGMIITTAIVSLVVILISFVAFYIARRIVRTFVARFVERTTTTSDNILIEKSLLNRLTLLVPVLVVHFFIPIIFVEYPHIEAFAERVVNLYFIVVVVLVLDVLITIFHSFYQTLKMAREIPLTVLFQVVKIVLYFVGIIFVVSVIFNQTPVFLFSGLGAMTAVLMLIFKDPILGFVAGMQLITNRMLKQGDWIEMPKYGADGDVIDITLTTVKVRNWDKTITTIPTYALISDSFKNWRGMQESGGRRIKRAINIDINSIRFCTPKMQERFVKIRYIADYMKQKSQELNQHNAGLGYGAQDLANARRLTNIGTFRAYVVAYLKNHPMINMDMTFLVRQLEPSEYGLPLEIYVFCKDKAWANYEAIQSDIFDHMLAILPEFNLRVFQYPCGVDLWKISGSAAGNTGS